jgi:hypothetical protein
MSCKPFIHLCPSTHLVSCHVTFHSSLTVHPFSVRSCNLSFIFDRSLHDMTPNGWTVKDEWKVYMTWHQMGGRSKMNERFTWQDTKWVNGQRWMKGLHDMTPNGCMVKDEWKVYMTWHQMSGRSKMNERFTWHDTKWVNGQRWMKGYMTWHQMGCC